MLRFAVIFTGLAAMPIEASDFREVSFPTADGGTVFANEYGSGDNAVVLAHGAVFNKESWGEQALELARAGLRVLAIDFRGYGKSRGPGGRAALYEDVLAAMRYLRESGANSVSLVGGSMGGGAAGRAAIAADRGQVDRLVLLAAVPVDEPEHLQGRKLFIVSKGDGLHDRVIDQFERANDPKRLEVLDGNAHAQHIFKTDQGPKLLALIRDWLTEGAEPRP